MEMAYFLFNNTKKETFEIYFFLLATAIWLRDCPNVGNYARNVGNVCNYSVALRNNNST